MSERITIIDFVNKYAEKYGNDTFLREKVDGVWTETSFLKTREEGRILAAGFMALGLQKGEKVVKSYAESLVSSFSFGNTANGITMPELGTDDAASTAVYAIDGKRLGSLQTIKTLPKGVYIIRKGNVSYKIVKTD